MRHVWFVCPFATPTKYGWPSRPYVLGKELVNRGYKVYIFSFTGNHYLRVGGYEAIKENSWESHKGIWFYWFKGIKRNKTNVAVRILNWLYFNYQFLGFLKSFNGAAPQIVILSSPPLTLANLITPLKKRLPNTKVLFEVRDLWPLSLINLGNFSPKHPFMQWLQKLEKKAYANADQVIGTMPGLKGYFHDIGLGNCEDKVHYLPHSASNDLKLPWSKDQIKYDIAYAGSLGRANDLMNLITSLQHLAEEGIFPQVLIIGRGPEEDKIKTHAANLSNVRLINQWLSRDQVFNELASCKVCYQGLKNLSIYKYGITCLKWMDYWMLKKPILFAYSGNLFNLKINDFGWRVPSEDPHALAHQIKAILNSNHEDLLEKGEKGFQYLKYHHHSARIVDAYEDLIN